MSFIPKAEARCYTAQSIVPWDMTIRHDVCGRHEDLSSLHVTSLNQSYTFIHSINYMRYDKRHYDTACSSIDSKPSSRPPLYPYRTVLALLCPRLLLSIHRTPCYLLLELPGKLKCTEILTFYTYFVNNDIIHSMKLWSFFT